MLGLRRAAFAVWLYGAIVIIGLGCTPALLGPRKASLRVLRAWARTVLWGLRTIMGVTVEVRGLNLRPRGAALIAGKHQSMLDVVVPFTVLEDPCFVLKRELMALPIFGWYVGKLRMVPIAREAQAAALKQMVGDVRARLAEKRQVLIFPEGTRTEPGAPPDYKPGVAALYRDLGLECVPLATNSGKHWPAHGLAFNPGRAVFEFLDPIPAGLKRPEFMRELEGRIELASTGLLAEVDASLLPLREKVARRAG